MLYILLHQDKLKWLFPEALKLKPVITTIPVKSRRKYLDVTLKLHLLLQWSLNVTLLNDWLLLMSRLLARSVYNLRMEQILLRVLSVFMPTKHVWKLIKWQKNKMTETEQIKVSTRVWPESWKLWDRTNPDDASFQFTLIITRWEGKLGCLEQCCVCVCVWDSREV